MKVACHDKLYLENWTSCTCLLTDRLKGKVTLTSQQGWELSWLIDFANALRLSHTSHDKKKYNSLGGRFTNSRFSL